MQRKAVELAVWSLPLQLIKYFVHACFEGARAKGDTVSEGGNAREHLIGPHYDRYPVLPQCTLPKLTSID